MGAKQSSNFADVDGNKHYRCFCFPTPLSRGNKTNDLLGSPMPETPISRRKKREFSSRYDGLEKEVVVSSKLKFKIPISKLADVHEGMDSEAALYNKYQLMEELGIGSTSTCYRCMDKSNGNFYACKIIDKQMIEERFQGMMDQFHTEIEALRSLHHPSIIELLDVYVSEEKIFIVMELMEGGELFDYVVQKGTLTEVEASDIVRKVTSAIVYMHSQNIVHRDLKPENLLLRRKPKNARDSVDVKIIDFGLSKCMTEPVAQSFLGTRGYLAPEMLQRRKYTKAVDTWALGVIVFVLLCGCLPFDDDSSTVPSDDLVRAKFVLRFPRWASNLSSPAKDLLSHLLDVNPARRYTAEQALDHPWVTGRAAPKGNMLASPGRIKKSPALPKAANKTPQSSGRKYHPPKRHQTPPPQRVMTRKTSI